MTTYRPNNYYSAPEVYHRPEQVPMEVLPSRSPEVAHDPRAYPPEIVSTNAPETAYGPQDFPPEAVPGQFPNDKDKTWEPDSGSVQNLVEEKAPKRGSFFKRHWKLITIFIILLIGGAVGGGVAGALASKKSKPKSDPTIVPAPENPPTNPAQKPLSLSLTTGLPAGAPKLLQETSIAATTCANEDRWVFMQDVAGNIRAAQYSTSNSSWTFATEQYNFTSVKLGTPLSASCVNITEDVGLDLGTYLSLVYINPSNEIQQTVLNGDKWKNSPVGQASKLPDDFSYLSISTHFLPTPLQDEPVSQKPNPPANKISPRSFSSVVTYQNNISLITIDLDPRLESNQKRHLNKNLLANFDGTQDVNYDTPIGFACDYNLPIPRNQTHYYTKCFMGNSRKLPRNDTSPDLVRIYDYIWEYPAAEAFDRTDKIYNYTETDSADTWYGIHLFGSEIVMTSIAENRSAIGFLSHIQKVVVSDIEPWHRNGTSGVEADNEDPEYTKVLPNLAFDMTSPHSSTVYVYYQANATAFGEILSDTSRNLWDDKPPQYVLVT